MYVIPVVCMTARPQKYHVPKNVTKKKLAEAINHAQLLCHGHEDTYECKNAWDYVRDLEVVLDRVYNNPPKELPRTEQANREYDV